MCQAFLECFKHFENNKRHLSLSQYIYIYTDIHIFIIYIDTLYKYMYTHTIQWCPSCIALLRFQHKFVETIFCLNSEWIFADLQALPPSLSSSLRTLANSQRWSGGTCPEVGLFLCMSQLLGPWTFQWFPKSMHFYWGFLRLHSHLYCLGLAQQSQEAVMTRLTHLEIFDQQCNKVSLNQLFWQDDFDETGNMKLHGVVYPRRWAT